MKDSRKQRINYAAIVNSEGHDDARVLCNGKRISNGFIESNTLQGRKIAIGEVTRKSKDQVEGNAKVQDCNHMSAVRRRSDVDDIAAITDGETLDTKLIANETRRNMGLGSNKSLNGTRRAIVESMKVNNQTNDVRIEVGIDTVLDNHDNVESQVKDTIKKDAVGNDETNNCSGTTDDSDLERIWKSRMSSARE